MRICRIAAVALLPVLGASIIGGCALIEDELGVSKRTQISAAGGAVGGGVIAAVAGANTMWIIASAVLGGVAGGVVSEVLGEDEAQQNADAGLDALENKDAGGQTEWENPATGNGGTITVDESFVTADGRPCKRFTQTITAEGETHTETGVACRSADGTWEVLAG